MINQAIKLKLRNTQVRFLIKKEEKTKPNTQRNRPNKTEPDARKNHIKPNIYTQRSCIELNTYIQKNRNKKYNNKDHYNSRAHHKKKKKALNNKRAKKNTINIKRSVYSSKL